MRLFAALCLPYGVKDGIESWRSPLTVKYPQLKWTCRSNLHVTLRFLGNVDPENTISQIKRVNLERFLPVEFSLERISTFGRPPSVLWLSGNFSRGAAAIASALGEIPDEQGFPEKRKFIPHVTVARAGKEDAVPPVSFNLCLRGEASAVKLFNSTLSPRGPVYRVLYTAGR